MAASNQNYVIGPNKITYQSHVQMKNYLRTSMWLQDLILTFLLVHGFAILHIRFELIF